MGREPPSGSGSVAGFLLRVDRSRPRLRKVIAGEGACALRKLADEIESGKVSLFSASISSHASHEEFTVREVTIEVLEEVQGKAGPQVIKG
jgi:hypothetical protein